MASERSAVSIWQKYLLFSVNFLIWLLSGISIGLSAWVIHTMVDPITSFRDVLLGPAYWLCIGGCLGFVISFFGWFGSLREIILFLKLYRYILLVFLFIQIAVIIFLFVLVYAPNSREQLGVYPEDSLTEAIVNYREDLDLQNLIDGMQKWLECCGISNDDQGYKDWSRNLYFNCSEGSNTRGYGEFCSVPFSCCIRNDDEELINYKCGEDMQSSVKDDIRSQKIYTRGCFKALSALMHDNIVVVAGVIIAILIPQIILSGSAANLIGQIKTQLRKLERSMRETAAPE